MEDAILLGYLEMSVSESVRCSWRKQIGGWPINVLHVSGTGTCLMCCA